MANQRGGTQRGGIRRRAFLRDSALTGLGGLGVSLLPLASRADEASPRVRRYVPLGRTGLQISDVSFGSSRLSGEPKLVTHALERGINYFDTAESYRGGDSEETLGQALQGHRNDVILASKTKCTSGSRRDDLMSALEGTLRRLRTDRVEIYFNHAVNAVDRLTNSEWYEFAERAKEQGKIRFTGLSGHAGRLVQCLDYAFDNDLVDVVLVGYNFGQDPSFADKFTKSFDFVALQPDLPRVLAKGKQKNVGVVAMKTLRGGRLNDLRPYESPGSTYPQAAFRWVLSSPNVDALVVSMTSTEQIDEYLGASGWKPESSADAALLDLYEERNGATQCRYGCDACTSSCPRGVEIPEVLRTRMYAEDYGDRELARGDYALLERDATSCLTCSGAPCAGACPYGLPISELTRRAHRASG